MACATPDLRLPSQPQGITVPNGYQISLLGDRGTCVRPCMKLLLESIEWLGIQPFFSDFLIVRRHAIAIS